MVGVVVVGTGSLPVRGGGGGGGGGVGGCRGREGNTRKPVTTTTVEVEVATKSDVL